MLTWKELIAKIVKKYDPKDLNTDWHDEWRDAMKNDDSDKEVA